MPIMRCTTKNGGKGWKYGSSGHCYGTREGALKQMGAMFHAGYKPAGASEEQTEEAAKETSLSAEAAEFLSADEDKSKIQAIKFDKSAFNRKSATAWAKEHGFKADFLFYAKDYIVLSQFPARTNASFKDVKVADGIALKVEGEIQSYSNDYLEAVKLKTGDRTEVSTETKRINDTMKPQTSVPMEQKFLFDKRRFSKESAKEWYRHYASKKYGMVKEDETVTLVEDGDFWVYECLPEKGFSKFKTLLEHEGVTVIVGIV